MITSFLIDGGTMKHGLFLALISAIGFGGWPLLSRASGANQLWINTILMVVSLAVALCFAHFSGVNVGEGLISKKGFALLCFAGLINGIGLVAFGTILTNPMEISTWVPVTNVFITLVSVLGGVLLFSESFPPQKMIGVALALCGVWLLNR